MRSTPSTPRGIRRAGVLLEALAANGVAVTVVQKAKEVAALLAHREWIF